MLCLPKSVRSSESMDEGKWGLQAKSRIQSQRPKPGLDTNTATGEQSSFTSSCWGCGVAAGMAAALSYYYLFLVTSEKMLRNPVCSVL